MKIRLVAAVVQTTVFNRALPPNQITFGTKNKQPLSNY
jgi:hypothetical protein